MTNAPEGRTYNDYNWELKSPSIRYPRFPQDYVQTATPHVVPNGKWLLEEIHGGYGWSWLIGIKHEELDDFLYTDEYGTRRVLLTSDKPFGYIRVEDEDVDKTVYPRVIKPTGRKRLVCAQQVHKGELGQSVPIERLKYVRQAFEPDTKQNVWKARERKRSNYGWVRLTDLAAAAGLTYEDIVFGFWQYSGHRNYHESGQLLDIVVAATPGEIEHMCPTVKFTTHSEASHLIRQSVEDMWVRRGFAYTVLRLLALGVRPEVTQPV